MKRYFAGILIALFCSAVMVVNASDCPTQASKAVCAARFGV